MNRAPRIAPAVPDPLALHDALTRSAGWTDLRERLHRSARLLDVLTPLLPGGLRAHVRPGPLDADGWTLLASNAAVAAKLRQLKPRLEQALRETLGPAAVLRIKVLAPSALR
ncbi:DciA family protein [Piscinibacter sakaiensis]|uniref:Zn-ribbon-containing protein n=1 Tax=Piscinibacter sakaiensis TaxID=1547922 RepID=A0A0K8NZF3_PISS1|nr:DciA family protein [Piscinibacter sakaiensis]GAP35310.1 Zn-ribbon-containing protein [Piscinibacter sakaiensis]